jgi:hypothetical protein
MGDLIRAFGVAFKKAGGQRGGQVPVTGAGGQGSRQFERSRVIRVDLEGSPGGLEGTFEAFLSDEHPSQQSPSGNLALIALQDGRDVRVCGVDAVGFQQAIRQRQL